MFKRNRARIGENAIQPEVTEISGKKTSKIVKTVNKRTKQITKRTRLGVNNNAKPNKTKSTRMATNLSQVDLGATAVAMPKILNKQNSRLVPIIETHGMKAKRAVEEDELSKLNQIDGLTSNEILGGNEVLNEGDDDEVNHDGVELSVNGSDVDEFPDDNTELTRQEPGELDDESDVEEEEVLVRNKVASKIVAVPKSSTPMSRPGRFDHLQNDPEFKQFLKEMVNNQMTSKEKADASPTRRKHSKHSKARNDLSDHKKGMVVEEEVSTQIMQITPTVLINRNTPSVPNTPIRQNAFKSPSDTTIYSPGLRKISKLNEEASIIEKISNFVENIRLDSGRGKSTKTTSRDLSELSTSISGKVTPVTGGQSRGDMCRIVSDEEPNCSTDAGHVTDQLLIQAEKFKAKVEAPKCNFHNMIMPYDYDQLRSRFVKPEGLAPIDNEIMFLRNFDQDNEFFHITSQIDPTIKAKIERGEYIELERLLPKDRLGLRNSGEDLNKQLFQLITQGTNSYVEPPAPKNGKINSIQKWDQAFRVYVAIYTHANPDRASEIWQYIYVIHTAAAANPWENVYFYDINF